MYEVAFSIFLVSNNLPETGFKLLWQVRKFSKSPVPTQGTLGFDYYYKMAFGGLVEHNNPNNLIQEAKQYIPAGSSWSDINKILSNEAKGTNQAKGEKCK